MTLQENETAEPKDPVSRCHRILAEPGVASATYEALVAGQLDRGLEHDDRPLSRALRPRLLPAAESRVWAEAGRLVARAARRLATQLVDCDLARAMGAEIVLDHVEAALARLPYPGQEPSLLGRLDGFGSGRDLRFVEYNADSCSCLIAQEPLAHLYTSTPAMRELSRTARIEPAPALDRIVDQLLHAWQAAGEPGAAPHVAVLDWPEGAWLAEFELIRSVFEARNIPALVCTPDELSFSAAGLMARTADGRDHPITLIYRRVLAGDLHYRYGSDLLEHPLVTAAAAGACAVVNPLAADLVQRKTLFALLSDERVLCWLPADEAAAVRRHVPWSRPVIAGRTVYQADQVDLLEFASTHRERLVLKPDNGYAGHGVVCGWDTSPARWDMQLKKALTTPHVLQERVRVPMEHYPYLHDGHLAFQHRIQGTDAMLVGDDVIGCVTRTATTSLVNVATGGDLIPVLTTSPLNT
ncbi:hypothetical protein [Actinomadura gamaensis]|uniref:Circularly permuted type 2 ATP-grasp protein n=1 Tax=Actinomadura gamaensis TaxID=1763541 RepID=A0ABV9UAN1_9ACTN